MAPSFLSIVLAAGIFPPDRGGPATYVPAMAAALVERGHRVEIVTLADHPNTVKDSWPFSVIRLRRGQNRVQRIAKVTVRLASLARRADLVFGNSLVIEPTLAALVTGKPLVIKVVGDPVWERARQRGLATDLDTFQTAELPTRWAHLRRFNALLHRRARRVIVPSEYLRRIVVAWGVPTERVRTIPNATSFAFPSDPPRSVQFDLVTVCRLVPWKGVDRLIRYASRNNRSLLVIGDGPERANLEALARSNGASTMFLGERPSVEIPTLIASARVFALASDYEGLPHVVLEAMAAAVPVVATDAGGTGEIVTTGESGLLVPPRDENMLARALTQVLESPALAERLVRGAQASLSRFAPETMIASTEAVLREAADPRSK